jgi:hypothetical protein
MNTSPRAVVPVASRATFSCGNQLRTLEYNDTARFIAYREITAEQIRKCPMLGTISALSSYHYLADKGGIPGIVKGVSYGSGVLAFDEGLNTFTYVCNSRVAGNRIKFGYGAEQRVYDRAEC